MQKIIVDCQTGEQTVVDLTPEEIAEHEKAVKEAIELDKQLEAERLALEEKRQSAKEKLEALGLTAEEIAAITGA
jgi:hypothetical protein